MKKTHTMSARAKRVLYPLLAVYIFVFCSFGVHLVLLGTSAFPGGKITGGRYWVEEHGKIIELTAGQFWFSYLHGVVFVGLLLALVILVLKFYSSGDLKNRYQE